VSGWGGVVVARRAPANGGDAILRKLTENGETRDGVGIATVRATGNSAHRGIRLRVTGNVTIGRASDPDTHDVVFDVESHDLGLEIGGDLIVTAQEGKMRSSSDNVLEVDGSVNIQGPFEATSGAFIDLKDSSTRTLVDVSATTQLWGLRLTDPGASALFETVDPIRIGGRLTVAGGSCAQTVTLASQTLATQFTLNITGSSGNTVSFARIRDSAISAATTATNSFNAGNNTANWTIGGCALPDGPPPDSLTVDGIANARAVSSSAPSFRWVNRGGFQAVNGDVEVYSSRPSGARALWRLDGSLADSSGSANPLTGGAPAYAVGRFSQAVRSVARMTATTPASDVDANGFTVGAWVRGTAASLPGGRNYVVRSESAPGVSSYELWLEGDSDRVGGTVQLTNGQWLEVDAYDIALDGAWHHLAMTYRRRVVALYVDGERQSTEIGDTGPHVPTTTASTYVADNTGPLDIDDVLIHSAAWTADDITGYFQTSRRHQDMVWDLDPTDTMSGAIGGPINDNAPFTIAYGGVANSLRLDGARYWTRARVRGVAAASQWSNADWFETQQSTTVSLASGVISNLSTATGNVLPGDNALGTATLTVTTSNYAGYTAVASGESDAWGMSNGLTGAGNTVPNIAPPASTVLWPAATNGFGVTVLNATGGKDVGLWGAPTTLDPTTMLALRWSAPLRSTPLLLNNRASYDPTANTLLLGLRANVPPATAPGRYTTSITVTTVPNL
jgi:hypothetical protein